MPGRSLEGGLEFEVEGIISLFLQLTSDVSPVHNRLVQLGEEAVSKFDLLVKRHELRPPVPQQLHDILTNCKIVLLCDDSGSMKQAVVEEGYDPFAPAKTTRWSELKKLAAVIIEFVTAANPEGLDIHFLNRPSISGVTDITGLQQVFANLPDGSTPLITSLRKIHNMYKNNLNDKQLLIVVITDGEPSDGSRNDLFYCLKDITSIGNVHVSFAECTDNEEDMAYLDSWDGKIKNFDNTDDYREELRRVKRAQGSSFKFDYTDYVIKILLATFVRWYFNLDQPGRLQAAGNNNDDCCCTIL